MADKKIVDLSTGVALGADDFVVLVQGNETLKISGQDVAWGVKTIVDLADKAYVDSVAAGGTGEVLQQVRNELNQVKTDVATRLPAGNFGLEFWSQMTNVSTYHIREDLNLYWTQQRFDNALAGKNTFHITEGSNLYFTNERARASVFDNRDIITFQNGGEVGNAQHSHQGSSSLGMDIYSPNTHDWVQLNYNDSNYVWVSNSLVGIDITKSNGSVVNWLFDDAGVLTLPIGGDIVDYYGNSVLGSGGPVDPTPTFDTVTILGSVTNSNHAATKAYVDTKVNDISAPTWSALTNVSNEFGPTRIALGRNAGGASDSGGYGGYGGYGGSSYAIAIGNSAGRQSQGGAAIGIGVASGNTDQGDSAIAIGLTAGNMAQGIAAIAIGESTGHHDQGANAIAIGNTAGYGNQGENAIAIGKKAGMTNQPAGSIVINASGNELDGSTAGFYVDPIRSASATSYVAYYNPSTKEVTYGPAPSGGGGVGTDPTFESVTTTDLNVQNVTFTGTGTVTINSSNDLNLTAVGNVLLNGERTISLNDLKTVVAASTDFADFKARIASL